MNAIRKFFLSAVALAALLTAARPAVAGTSTLMFDWETYTFPDSCLGPWLAQQGQGLFVVNSVPIPTFTLSANTYTDGHGLGEHQAPFNSALLRVGANRLQFRAANSNDTPWCNHVWDRVWLSSPTSPPQLLWDFVIDGEDVDIEKSVEKTLEDIDPALAQHIAEFRHYIDVEIARLMMLGPQADNAARDIARLQGLLAAIDELLQRGFDQITTDELDALLADFNDLLPGLRDQLAAIIDGFKKDIADLRAELERIETEYRDWASDITNYGDAGGGFEGSDFETPTGDSLPEMDIPDVLGDDPWDPQHDIYDDYANEVIAALTAMLDSSQAHVSDRRGFVDIIGGWRLNIRAIEAALRAQAIVNQAEYGAFLQSRSKVLSFTSRFMDRDGWFYDAEVDPEIKFLINTALYQRDAPTAERMKAALNVMTKLNNEQASLVFGWLYIMKEAGDAAQQASLERRRAELALKERSLWDSTLSFLDRAASFGWDVAVAVTPLGDIIDACELITGKEGCHLISGRELTWEERAFAGVGLFMWGSNATIRKLASKVDSIKCRPGHTFAGHALVGTGGIAHIAPVCKFYSFMSKLENAMDGVQHKTPVKEHTRASIRKPDGTWTYIHNNGTVVQYNERGFPLFEPQHMHPADAKVPNPEVWVEFTCESAKEISRANAANNIANEIADHTWHHSHEFEYRTDGRVYIKMQLLKDEVHDWAKHAGGSAIGRQILGKNACQ
jgi:hypothetical protein